MKRPLIALLLLASLPVLPAQKMRYGQEPAKAKPGVDYPIQVHVSGVHVRQKCSTEPPNGQPVECHDVLYADVALNGKKMELMGDWIWYRKFSGLAITSGDYQARVVESAHESVGAIGEEYELLTSGRHVWRCAVTGMFE